MSIIRLRSCAVLLLAAVDQTLLYGTDMLE